MTGTNRLLRPGERRTLQAVAKLSYCNPFLPERIDCERLLLGEDYTKTALAWNLSPGLEQDDPNVAAICARAETLAAGLRERLLDGDVPADADELQLYEELVLFVLYYRNSAAFAELIGKALAATGARSTRAAFYEGFRRDAQHLLDLPGRDLPALHELPHVFACYYQIRRAFHHIFYNLVGTSGPTARLRAAVWQSIFSHDLRRYRRTLHARMADFATLIVGPSGTGKELVARAIGFARYIPFRAQALEFAEDFYGSFQGLNLTALAPTLIESELFGHKRGAFTGAIADRPGYFETCPPLGTVFLDEIGDLDPAIQVKLLHVLQNRTFQRAGDTKARKFQGKIIAATNRDLGAAIESREFRADLYYRLCGDVVEMPSLRERLSDDPAELRHLLLFLARRELGQGAEALAAEVEQFVLQQLGADYAWPGNVRELEQCLRNVLLRHAYHPRRSATITGEDPRAELAQAVRSCSLDAGELLRRYTTLVYLDEDQNLEATARRLDLDRRTVKRHVEAAFAARLRQKP
ncbi:MAG TPA: sigma 54-interacting transcriptional regulator [Planctomycetota bacterium]|nr:sigma 54-interacting transcriptional regulator [Planctomycetota bacterium]